MQTITDNHKVLDSGYHVWTCQGQDLYDVHDLERCNRRAGQHFFDAETKRFFSSRISEVLYSGPGGVFFVTSEQFKGFRGPNGPRAYTVRRFNVEDASVDTMGAFNELSRATAHRLAKSYALNGVQA